MDRIGKVGREVKRIDYHRIDNQDETLIINPCDNQDETFMIIKINDTSIGDLP
jgi:hypothetical protein